MKKSIVISLGLFFIARIITMQNSEELKRSLKRCLEEFEEDLSEEDDVPSKKARLEKFIKELSPEKESHLKDSSIIEYSIGWCGFYYKNHNSLQEIDVQEHLNRQHNQCGICQKEYSTLSELRMHEATHITQNDLRCQKNH